MSRAGQAGEVGSVFRGAVAVHLAVHGLRSRQISGLELSNGIDPVRLDFETADFTDDIRVTFSDGRRAYVSAKRKVTKGRPLQETIAGWAGQAALLGPDDLLVIAGEEFVGPMKDLDRVLRRHRDGLPMETGREIDTFNAIDRLLPASSRARILERARVIQLDRATDGNGSRDLLAALMDPIIADLRGPEAVAILADLFHTEAGTAHGSGIDDWIRALGNHEMTVFADRTGPAGMRAAARLYAVRSYRDHLAAKAGRIDLSLLADDLPPVVVDDLLSGLKIHDTGDNSSSTAHQLLPYLRRWRRMLVIGQPGSGKSVALREIAVRCATQPYAPVPLIVSLPRLLRLQPDGFTVDGLIEIALAGRVSPEHRSPLADHLATEILDGRAMILCDGLDECGDRAPWVAQQLANILSSLHEQTGFVVATRANAQLAAGRLGLPQVALAPPRDLDETVDRVLVACADARLSESDRADWLAVRRAWISDARHQHDHLLTVPLLAILLALVCANTSDDDLPKGRATLLHRAVEESVRKWERTRDTFADCRPWAPDLTPDMLLDGFVVLGRSLDGDVTRSRPQALTSLADMLIDPDRWAQSPARSRELARDILRFWDEQVAVFVVNDADELTSRSKVFAEIATAMWARDCASDQLTIWLRDTLRYTDSDGAIALAAGLDNRTVGALLSLGDVGEPESTLMVADLATREIVSLQPDQSERILSQLATFIPAALDGARPPKRVPRKSASKLAAALNRVRPTGPWSFVEAACRLPLSPRHRAQRAELISAAELDARSIVIATALQELTDATTDGVTLSNAASDTVTKALATPLPQKTGYVQQNRRSIVIGRSEPVAPGLEHVALGAASRLTELPDGSGDRLLQIAMRTSVQVSTRICEVLERAGVDTSPRWSGLVSGLRALQRLDRGDDLTLLDDLASIGDPTNVVDGRDLWSLADLGDLLAATGYGTVGIGDFAQAFSHTGYAERRAWLDAIADAHGIDKDSVARQAQHVVEATGESARIALSEEWSVATTRPVARRKLRTDLAAALTADQQHALLRCLDVASDWIAWSAADVLINLSPPEWDVQAVFDRDLTGWALDRAGLIYMVAILTLAASPNDLLTKAADSTIPSYRYAARQAIGVAPELDPDGSLIDTLCADVDLSVRPRHARQPGSGATQWTCVSCGACNDLETDDCPGCDHGIRPEYGDSAEHD